jgi:hypothetical protein
VIQKPSYIDADFRVISDTVTSDATQLGAVEEVRCNNVNPLVFGVIGAIAMYALPPLLSGLIEGIREGWDERD